ncbi:MAG: hypothetical protein PQ964_03980 [Methanobacteriaceae archaeon]
MDAAGTLAICAIAAYIDEIGNDNKKVYEKSRILEIFFKYRFALKTVILVLALFLIFELAYEFTGLKFDSIYERIYSVIGLTTS